MSLQNFVERTTFRVIRPPCLSTGVTPVETSFQTEENLAEHPEINQQHCKKKKTKKLDKNFYPGLLLLLPDTMGYLN